MICRSGWIVSDDFDRWLLANPSSGVLSLPDIGDEVFGASGNTIPGVQLEFSDDWVVLS